MDAKILLKPQEEILIDQSGRIFARMFASPDGQQFLQTEDGRRYLQITTRDLPVIRALLHLASDDEASSESNALLVVKQEPEEVPFQASLVQGVTAEAVEAHSPPTAVDELPKRKSIADIIAEVLQDAPHHILTVDEMIAATKERGVEVKRETLRFTLSAKDQFHPVEKGSGRWTLKPYATTKATAKIKPQAKTSLSITGLAAELKDFFKENEFRGRSQPATIDAIWNRFVEVNRPEVFVDLQTAVWLCQWVGSPVGGNDVRKKKQNVSKLLRMNERFVRNEDGYYGLKESLPNIPRSNPAFDFEADENQSQHLIR